ncbi:MAG: pyridine nucleotide-disulfide oxidoreductase, partial [Thermotogae bacterium]
MRPYMEYTKEVRVIDNPDLLVVGGGIAGFSAAVAAKRAGVDVMLIEQYS